MVKFYTGLNKYSGFSLVEMLMALLVASLLMAALAPVMTKKVQDSVKINGLGETYKAPADMQCFSYSDSNPTVNVSLNDVYAVSFLIASAGGGGAGATSTKKVPQTPVQITGKAENDSVEEVTITEYMTDVKVTLAGGGGGGAGGAGYVSPCPNETYQFNGNSSVKSFCMTRFNVGEQRNNIQKRDQDYIPKCPSCWFYGSNDMSAAWESKCGSAQSGNCCWYAASNEHLTAHPDECSSTVGYNACARTVCQYNAAKSGCSDFTYVPSDVESASWSLPSSAQAIYLKSFNSSQIGILGGKGVYLCSAPFIPGVDLCSTYISHCWGSDYGDNSNICYPQTLWVAEQKMMWMIVRPEIGANGLYGPHDTQARSAYSARCTLDKTNLFKSYSGGGGSSGAYIQELDITNYVKLAGVNGKIIMTAGKPGKGGNAASGNNTKASNGADGNYSKIIIQNKDGKTIYGIRTTGGSGGKSAENVTVSGSAAVNTNIPATGNCEYTTDGTNWTNTACTKIPVKGGNGAALWKSSATEGSAANSPITSNTSGNGAGGKGGTSSYGYNDKIVPSAGTDGKSGLVKLTYNNEYAAAPGGGGGGGTVAQIKNVQLGRQAECTLTIGKGGKGGQIDNDGLDGGASSVKCNTDSRTFIVPGGKGGKKGTPASAVSGASSLPVSGLGGKYGDTKNAPTTAVNDYNASRKVISEGTAGVDGAYNAVSKSSIGGRGGTSGTGTKGACGGLYVETDEKQGICKISDTDLKRIEGKGFKYEETVMPTANELTSSFGIAGAGGGGGGWIRELGSAGGGNGMNGYVCVYWFNE